MATKYPKSTNRPAKPKTALESLEGRAKLRPDVKQTTTQPTESPKSEPKPIKKSK